MLVVSEQDQMTAAGCKLGAGRGQGGEAVGTKVAE